MLFGALIVTLAAAFAVLSIDSPNDGSPREDRLVALQINVVDMDRAIAFYAGPLELTIISRDRYPQSVTLACDEIQILLTACDSLTDWDYNKSCKYNLNLYVEDLAAFIEKCKKSDGRMLDDSILRAGVGKYIRIADPSGNEIHVMELGCEHKPVTRPTFYNIGTAITDMPRARSFYEGLLGFEVFSLKYYPPVIPYKVRGAQLILHERGTAPSAAASANSSQMIPILIVQDLKQQVEKLGNVKTNRVADLHIANATGSRYEVHDPDGNLIYLMEWAR